MPALGPISRRDLIAYLRQLGFDGPYSRRRHQHMQKGAVRATIPNPHRGDIGRDLLRSILREAQISIEEWERL